MCMRSQGEYFDLDRQLNIKWLDHFQTFAYNYVDYMPADIRYG